MESVFDDAQLLDDLIVGYCDIFSESVTDWNEDFDPLVLDGEFQDTNDSYYDGGAA